MNRKRFLRTCVCGLLAVSFLQLSSGAEKGVKVACVGDSITYGAGIKDRKKNSYPAQLQSLLGEGYQVRNFGNSGSTLLKKGDKHDPNVTVRNSFYQKKR